MKWIIKYLYGIESSRVKQIDLETLFEKAESQLEDELKQLREQQWNLDVVDANTFKTSRTKNDCKVPKSIHAYIKFDPDGLMQVEPELVFRGTFLEHKKVVIRNLGFNKMNLYDEMAYADLTRSHGNYLQHFFGFEQENCFYVAVEHYEHTLENLSPFIDTRINSRCITAELLNAMEFLHNLQSAHMYLRTRNTAMIARGDRFVCKIFNFSNAGDVRQSTEKDFQEDVLDLGMVLLHVLELQRKQNSNQNEDFSGDWCISDELLIVDLIKSMTKKKASDRPTFKELLTHPFLWSPRDTIHFIIHVAKQLETNTGIQNILKRHQSNIFTDDWRQFVDMKILRELDDINRQKLPDSLKFKFHSCDISLRSDVIGLIKTIRNLVIH